MGVTNLWKELRDRGLVRPVGDINNLSGKKVGVDISPIFHALARSCPGYLLGGNAADRDDLKKALEKYLTLLQSVCIPIVVFDGNRTGLKAKENIKRSSERVSARQQLLGIVQRYEQGTIVLDASFFFFFNLLCKFFVYTYAFLSLSFLFN